MPGHARATVLTVEDDPIVRVDLRLILEDAGFDVCSEARDGLEAVERAREHRPDLILLDLGLPKLDGVEAARRILRERDVPIIALTGRSNVEGMNSVVGAGATSVVLKPFSERDLVGKLRDALDDHLACEQEHDRLRVLIESMVREGRSEREITAAVSRVAGSDGRRDTRAPGWLRRTLGRMRRGT